MGKNKKWIRSLVFKRGLGKNKIKAKLDKEINAYKIEMWRWGRNGETGKRGFLGQ